MRHAPMGKGPSPIAGAGAAQSAIACNAPPQAATRAEEQDDCRHKNRRGIDAGRFHDGNGTGEQQAVAPKVGAVAIHKANRRNHPEVRHLLRVYVHQG